MLNGKVAAITGAAGGIGRASAIQLANDGADIAILDINERGLAETKQIVENQTGRVCLPIKLDLLDRESIKQAFNRIKLDLGFIEILHNNAGGNFFKGQNRSFPKASTDQWDQIVDLNLRAVADCTREVVGPMKEAGCGRIINTCSEMAYRGDTGFTEYCAAKAGVLGFTRSLAVELGPYGITVNAICPGVIKTPALDQMPQDLVEDSIKGIPMRRLGAPEDIAHAVSYLASPGASYVTGASLLVTGGRTLH